MAKRASNSRACFWLGLVLFRSVKQDARIVGPVWLDGSPVDFGNPLTTPRGQAPWRLVPGDEPNDSAGHEYGTAMVGHGGGKICSYSSNCR